MAEARPRGVLLLGSVPLESSEEVFRTVGPVLGPYLRRIPDGETDERRHWVQAQLPVLLSQPQCEAAPLDPELRPVVPRVRLRAGTSPEAMRFDRLGYLPAAKASYALFSRLKREGVIPARCRFQFGFPPPASVVLTHVAREHQAAVEPSYTAAFLAEVDAICAAIPHEELAIQWDVSREMAVWEGFYPAPYPDPRRGVIERLAQVGERIPPAVELGYHLCYGDYQHRHWKQPEDMGKLVEVANELAAAVPRPIHWIHIPVPRDRDDDAYFAPLRDLRLRAETELYLGLVHHTDGLEGTRRRIAAANRVVSGYGVATECGWGRRAPATIPELMRIHATVADPIG